MMGKKDFLEKICSSDASKIELPTKLITNQFLIS
jgi:hypothetical protein